jgi:superfamily II DNA/RNA helicase
MEDIKVYVLLGGNSTKEDAKNLGKKPQIVIGCPSRVLEMKKNNLLNT